MGAGGIGFDVTDLITHDGPSGALDVDVFARSGVSTLRIIPELVSRAWSLWLPVLIARFISFSARALVGAVGQEHGLDSPEHAWAPWRQHDQWRLPDDR